MICVVTRVSSASVISDGELTGKIGTGFLVLLGVEANDTESEAEYLAGKVSGLRIFSDKEGKMNLSLADVKGELIVVSNFTLAADCRKGKRPDFFGAARPETARPLYELFMERLRGDGHTVYSGVFGANMQVESVNDGPVTIVLDTAKMRA